MLKKFLDKKIKLYIALIIFVILLGIIMSEGLFLLDNYQGETKVIGKGVGIYWDTNCDNPVNNISWGTMTLRLGENENKNLTIYVRNEEPNPISLSMNITRITPPTLIRYVNVGWNYENQKLQPNEITKLNITLSIKSNILNEVPHITKYNFDIIILGVN